MEQEKIDFSDLRKAIRYLVLLFVLLEIAQAIVVMGIPKNINTNLYRVIVGVAYSISFLLPIIFVTKKFKLNEKQIFRLNHPSLFYYFVVGLFLIALSTFYFGYNSLMMNVLPENIKDYLLDFTKRFDEQFEMLLVYSSFDEMMLAVLIGAVAPAFCEELLFRGYLLKYYSMKYDSTQAIIFTSIIFSIIHFNPAALIGIFFIGVALGVLTVYSNSIYPAIMLHFLNNYISIMFLNSGVKELADNSYIASLEVSIYFFVIGLVLFSLVTAFVIYNSKQIRYKKE